MLCSNVAMHEITPGFGVLVYLSRARACILGTDWITPPVSQQLVLHAHPGAGARAAGAGAR